MALTSVATAGAPRVEKRVSMQRMKAHFALACWLWACAPSPSVPPPPPPDPPDPQGSAAPEPSAEKTAAAPLPAPPPSARGPVTFDDDLTFLKQHGDVRVLSSTWGGQVAVSAQYQGRVMTSAVDPKGQSLGFVFRKFIQEGKTGTQFDNYGGEDRFWLGPEAGQYGLYFPKGKPFAIEHWKTPDAFQTGSWKIVEQTQQLIRFEQPMKVENYSGQTFELNVSRTVRLLDEMTAAKFIEVRSPWKDVKWVAFETLNRVTNTGKAKWTKDKGLLSIWILGMYNPSPDTQVIIPFDASAKGEIVNDRYFGKVPADRLRIDEKAGVLFFSADGQHRSKIGLGPARAKSVAGSYSPSAKLLTIVQYSGPKKGGDYVNSMWEQQKEPFKGDAVNSYNDGPTEPGKPSLGGFYELESSSHAAELGPGAALEHSHRTFHFVGEPAALEPIAKKVLGVSLSQIK